MSVALSIDPCEVQIKAIRAQGPGAQNVHKVATAVQLFFDIRASSLPQEVKERCLALADQRITQDVAWWPDSGATTSTVGSSFSAAMLRSICGNVVVIKAQSQRTQELNRQEALRRLHMLIAQVLQPPRVRRPTRPTYGSQQRRLAGKAQRATIKAGRGRVL